MGLANGKWRDVVEIKNDKRYNIWSEAGYSGSSVGSRRCHLIPFCMRAAESASLDGQYLTLVICSIAMWKGQRVRTLQS